MQVEHGKVDNPSSAYRTSDDWVISNTNLKHHKDSNNIKYVYYKTTLSTINGGIKRIMQNYNINYKKLSDC